MLLQDVRAPDTLMPGGIIYGYVARIFINYSR